MKTILVDLTSLADNFSGIERFALSITKELVKHKDLNFILVFKNKVHDAFKAKQDNVKKVVLKGANKLVFNQVVLPLNLAKIKADYYLFMAFPAPFLFFKKNTISAIHDMGCWDCPQTNKWWMTIYFKILYRKATSRNKKVITVSEFSKKRIHEILRAKNSDIWVIYNGISDVFLKFKYEKDVFSKIEKKYRLPDRYILCLSTIEPRKNIGLLIQTYEQMVHSKTDAMQYDLVFAGRDGWKNRDIYETISEDVKERIHFTGFVDEQDLPYVYSGARCFVFPSIYEGFGIPPIEALACGIQVLSSDAASMPEILQGKAHFFRSNNAEDLKKQLYNLLQKDEQHDYSDEIKSLYNWRQQADKLYRNIVNEK